MYGGERLIKAVYEAIRNSPVWNTSLLIIVYDEHGGFYDSVRPGPAPSPDDLSPGQIKASKRNRWLRLHAVWRACAAVNSHR